MGVRHTLPGLDPSHLTSSIPLDLGGLHQSGYGPWQNLRALGPGGPWWQESEWGLIKPKSTSSHFSLHRCTDHTSLRLPVPSPHAGVPIATTTCFGLELPCALIWIWSEMQGEFDTLVQSYNLEKSLLNCILILGAPEFVNHKYHWCLLVLVLHTHRNTYILTGLNSLAFSSYLSWLVSRKYFLYLYPLRGRVCLKCTDKFNLLTKYNGNSFFCLKHSWRRSRQGSPFYIITQNVEHSPQFSSLRLKLCNCAEKNSRHRVTTTAVWLYNYSTYWEGDAGLVSLLPEPFMRFCTV